MTDEQVRAHLFVAGMVQGVFFRHEASRRAASRGLSGWIRNLPDGRVEAVFEGGADSVDSMVRWCHEGPGLARVTSVDVEWESPAGESGFRIR